MSAKREFVSGRQWSQKVDQGGRTSIKVPPGWGFFTVTKTGTYLLDFAPYIVGKGNPAADEGMLYWERTYFCHFGIGPDSSAFCCPAKHKRGRCPVCEDRAAKLSRDDLDEKTKDSVSSSLRWKERQLFIVRDAKDKDAGWKLWDFSYHNFGKLLKTLIDEMPDEADYDMFAHPDQGYTLSIIFTEETTGSNKYKKAAAIQFVKRKPLDIDVEEMPCLDDLLIIPDYDTLRKAYFQLGDEEENDPPVKSGRESLSSLRKSAKQEEIQKDEDADEDEKEETGLPDWCAVGRIVIYKDLECEVKRISKDGKTLTLEDEDQEIYRGIAPKECVPYVKAAAKNKRKKADEDDDD